MDTAIVSHPEQFYLDCLTVALGKHYPNAVIQGVRHVDALLRVAAEMAPDVILMLLPHDLAQLKDIAAIRQVTPRSKIILIADQIPDIRIADVIRQGADGYLSSQSGLQELFLALDEVEHNRRHIDLKLISYEQLRKIIAVDAVPLTPREHEVLEYLVRGLSNKLIAQEMVSRAGGHIKEQTVKTYVSNILSKLHVSSRQEAIVLAIQKRLVSIGNAWDATPASE